VAFSTPASIGIPSQGQTKGVRPKTPAKDDTTVTDESGYFTVRRDLRRCASPLCGGYFVKLVNQANTRCANGRDMAECYVAKIDWNGQPEVEIEKALLRGSITTNGDKNGKYGVFSVSESWQRTGKDAPGDTFYRVRDLGLRCIAAPCLSYSEAKLNTAANRTIAGVVLENAAAEDDLKSAYAALTGPSGVIANGKHLPVSGPAGKAESFEASQFFLRMTKAVSTKPCVKTGCGGQICAAEEVYSTCIYRSEYECYKKAACERQANGECGFTKTAELTSCLKQKGKKVS
jgi:hypothetical protein